MTTLPSWTLTPMVTRRPPWSMPLDREEDDHERGRQYVSTGQAEDILGHHTVEAFEDFPIEAKGTPTHFHETLTGITIIKLLSGSRLSLGNLSRFRWLAVGILVDRGDRPSAYDRIEGTNKAGLIDLCLTLLHLTQNLRKQNRHGLVFAYRDICGPSILMLGRRASRNR
ncbi:hypothetical protein FVEN_g3689 [Fusarium venenatum]|uniref:Uncharacterized protein n=1 Tax=Fusarium venenatum TaxID=56646 RepID=A0A2L2T6A1_9HYPO|nr:uncharacterized protein FVRRES_13650 [Fusarium venenatum]KAG8358651.1 hypothetical protein FVEN_g3689 [Fusarium venenatum]CEI41593.1 unnamed protein product [Fusarium venenatum]